MSTFDLENIDPKAGDALRDEAANLLSVRFGRPQTEHRVAGKKADIYFIEKDRFGKSVRYYLECKDYASPLGRSEMTYIWSDYSGIIQNNKPSLLVVITRCGLTADAQSFIDEQSDLRHQTIWELENDTLGLREYVRDLSDLFDKDGLSEYYIDSSAREAHYDEHFENRETSETALNIFIHLNRWVNSDEFTPVAILGGYGAGKTSLAYRLASSQAKNALHDPFARIPVLIRLGAVARYSTLDGLVGFTISRDSRINSFSFSFFMEMNRKGRLLIILDGFDEMKHAMTWSDFREQLHDLNQLTQGSAKVVLLGRPNAFISFEEQLHVLRGVRKFANKYRKIPGWPQFKEFDLEHFTNEARKSFVSPLFDVPVKRGFQ